MNLNECEANQYWNKCKNYNSKYVILKKNYQTPKTKIKIAKQKLASSTRAKENCDAMKWSEILWHESHALLYVNEKRKQKR